MEGNLAILTKILFKHCWWNENEKNLCGRKRICEIVSIQMKKQYTHFSDSVCSPKYLLYRYIRAKQNILGYQYNVNGTD